MELKSIIKNDTEVLNKLKVSVEKYEDNVTLLIDTKLVDVSKISCLFSEKYGTFYPNLVSIGCSMRGVSISSVYSCKFTFKYRIGKVKLSMMEIETDKKVKEISQMIFLPDMPMEAKILIAHNYLCVTVEYNKDWENKLTTSYTQSAYGALVEHRCVCQGFTEAYKRLLDECGVWCETISGKIVGESGLHAWNIINLGKNDSYHHVDVTWDAGSNKPEYTYFCKSDKFFEGKRIWDRNIYPKCSGRYSVLSSGRLYILQNKKRLLNNGTPIEVIN